MQPYFFPYIGYFQLISAVDEFIVYDHIKFSKKGWINRNRILVNGSPTYITLPLSRASDHLNVNERFLSGSWVNERRRLINRITESYRRAPQFDTVFPLLETCLFFDNPNLFDFINHSLGVMREYLEIDTRITISSTISYDQASKAENKVLSLLKAVGAKGYINPIGGQELYSRERFHANGVDLAFLRSGTIEYRQFQNPFVPNLSIIDVAMFNPKEAIKRFLGIYDLI